MNNRDFCIGFFWLAIGTGSGFTLGYLMVPFENPPAINDVVTSTRCVRNDYPMATKCLDCHNEKELIKSWSENNYLRVLRTYQSTNYDQFAMKGSKFVTPVITTQQVIGYIERGKEVIVMEVGK